jgi:hypothetical protein
MQSSSRTLERQSEPHTSDLEPGTTGLTKCSLREYLSAEAPQVIESGTIDAEAFSTAGPDMARDIDYEATKIRAHVIGALLRRWKATECPPRRRGPGQPGSAE